MILRVISFSLTLWDFEYQQLLPFPHSLVYELSLLFLYTCLVLMLFTLSSYPVYNSFSLRKLISKQMFSLRHRNTIFEICFYNHKITMFHIDTYNVLWDGIA